MLVKELLYGMYTCYGIFIKIEIGLYNKKNISNVPAVYGQ